MLKISTVYLLVSCLRSAPFIEKIEVHPEEMSDQEEASGRCPAHLSYGAPVKWKKKKHSTLAASQSQQPRLVQASLNMFRMTPEQVVQERHTPGFVPPAVKLSKRKKEQLERLHMQVADFFYECGIPLTAANSRSFEIMLESIAQYGPGYVSPSPDELRGPLLEKKMKDTQKLREKRERAWKSHGCTLMLDSWADHRRDLHWINFLVNSVQGTFFLESVDVSNQLRDAVKLADLIEKRIEVIGRDKVVQVVSDTSDNLKAACVLLMEKIPTLFWTPCAFRCVDLMLEDIARLKEFKKHIEHAKRVTTFIYRHERLLYAMMEKIGGKDIVVPTATRFSTTFLTLESLYKHRDDLMCLFVNEDWSRSKLASTEAGKKVCAIVLSTRFWDAVEDCTKASEQLLVVLRMIHGDERPAMPEVSIGMDLAKKKINDSFASKPIILKKVMDIIERRWANQMEQKLYGAALFLNPNLFFDIKENDCAYASRLRAMFNDVIEKMVNDDVDLFAKISALADQYESNESSFGMILPTMQRKAKSPNDWWRSYGGCAGELRKFAWRIVGLCCSAAGYERNWSTFESIHTMQMNQLEHKRLKDLVYIRYNQKMASRFQRQRVEGSNFNPLVLEDFELDNEWFDMNAEEVHTRSDLSWAHVDEITGASHMLQGHSVPRTHGEVIGCSPCGSSTSRLTDEPDLDDEEDEPFVVDDEDVEDDYGQQDPPTPIHESDRPRGNESHMNDFELDDDF